MRWLTFKSKSNRTLTPLEAYNKWAASYSEEKNPVKELSNNLVIKFLPNLQNKTILDFGCGTGYFCSMAKKLGALEVTGIDLSPAMVDAAKKNCPEGKFFAGNISDIELKENYFDVAIAALVLAHLPEFKSSLLKILKALKPDGKMIITDFHPFLTLSGAKRTFKDSASGKQFEIEHHVHLFSEYFSFLKEHGFTIEAFDEPTYLDKPVVFGLVATSN
jgi:malonyl-CoA O-methyltransferase